MIMIEEYFGVLLDSTALVGVGYLPYSHAGGRHSVMRGVRHYSINTLIPPRAQCDSPAKIAFFQTLTCLTAQNTAAGSGVHGAPTFGLLFPPCYSLLQNKMLKLTAQNTAVDKAHVRARHHGNRLCERARTLEHELD